MTFYIEEASPLSLVVKNMFSYYFSPDLYTSSIQHKIAKGRSIKYDFRNNRQHMKKNCFPITLNEILYTEVFVIT